MKRAQWAEWMRRWTVVALLGCCLLPHARPQDSAQLSRQSGLDDATVRTAMTMGAHVHRLTGADANGMERLAAGITVEVPGSRASAQAEALRRLLGPGYVVFISQRRHAIDGQPDDVSVIRSNDPFDALRVMNTSGSNYALSSQRVIAKLRDWDHRYGLQIVGAGYDWLEARIQRVPTDARAFAVEVAQFCPDVVSEINSIDRLGLEIQLTRTLHLWWD